MSCASPADECAQDAEEGFPAAVVVIPPRSGIDEMDAGALTGHEEPGRTRHKAVPALIAPRKNRPDAPPIVNARLALPSTP